MGMAMCMNTPCDHGRGHGPGHEHGHVDGHESGMPMDLRMGMAMVMVMYTDVGPKLEQGKYQFNGQT